MTQNIDLKNLDKSTWRTFRFDQLAQKVSETVDPKTTDLEIYVGLEHLDRESIHLKRKGVPSDVSGGKLKCYPGDVIFGKRRAYQRKAAIVDFEGICSAHAFVLRANPEVIDPDLFTFFLHSDLFMHCAVDISVGGLSPTINWGQLKEQEFLLPPKDQQAQLAKLLWAMDEVIENEKGAESILIKLYKKSIEQSLLGGIKKDISQFEKKPGFLPNKLPELPVDWKYSKVSEHIWFQEGPGVRSTQFREDGVKLLNGTNINDNVLNLASTNRHVSENEAFGTYSHFLCDEGDLIIACSGITVESFDEKIAYVNINHLPLCMNTSTMRFKVLNGDIELDFFKYFLMSQLFKFQIKRLITGSAQLNFGPFHMGKIYLPLPSIDEQRNIIKRLNKIQDSLSNLESKISVTKSLQKSLINQVF